MPRICVIIVTYKSDATIERCLMSLEAQTCRDFEVVITENGQTAALDSIAARLTIPHQIIRPGKNLGFAAGNNLAAQHAAPDTEWLAFLNPDAFAAGDWLEQFIAALDRYPRCGMFGSLQRNAARPEICDGFGDRYHAFGLIWRMGHGYPVPKNLRDVESFSPCAASSFVRADLFKKLDGYDEDFFCYTEDIDLAFRARLLGEYCVQLASCRVDHVNGASRTSAFAVYYGMRNLPWVFIKNMPQPLFALLLPFHILAMLAFGCRHLFSGHAKPAWQGLYHSVRRIKIIWPKRKTIQTARQVSATEIAEALTWSLVAPFRHLLRKKR